MPTAEALLKHARAKLSQVDSPALDARLLLQHVTGLDHATLVAEPGFPVTDTAAEQFEALVARRAGGEPVSRILGARAFYGRDFVVTSAVLDPRPDTEVLIDVALQLLPAGCEARILDLGTGSGIIAITLLAERLKASAVAVDISVPALAVATENAVACGVSARLHTLPGSWFEPVDGEYDAIVSNPPYIPEADAAALAVDVRDHDPALALFGGDDGLDCYRAIAAGAARHLAENGFIAVEVGAGQAGEVSQIFANSGFHEASRHLDLGGHERVLVFLHHTKRP